MAAYSAGAKGENQGLTMGSDDTNGDPTNAPSTSDAQENLGLAPVAPAKKEKKTAAELAAMIRQDLGEIEGFPQRGVNVTVYGFSPWNSLLTFGIDAGPVRNKADLQGLCDFITERLKRLYEVAF